MPASIQDPPVSSKLLVMSISMCPADYPTSPDPFAPRCGSTAFRFDQESNKCRTVLALHSPIAYFLKHHLSSLAVWRRDRLAVSCACRGLPIMGSVPDHFDTSLHCVQVHQSRFVKRECITHAVYHARVSGIATYRVNLSAEYR